MVAAIIDGTVYQELVDSAGADFVVELVDTYCQETAQLITGLHSALEHDDASTFRRHAHSIKSSSATFGATDFAAQARELEMIGKSGDLSGAGPKVTELTVAFDSVTQALRERQHGG
jgi:histidine phosphotransfer protein HptB